MRDKNLKDGVSLSRKKMKQLLTKDGIEQNGSILKLLSEIFFQWRLTYQTLHADLYTLFCC